MVKKVASGVIFVLLFSPLFASAQTTDGLQAQIQDLIIKINVLRNALTGAAAAGLPDDYGTDEPEGYCPGLTRTLQRGATDARMGGQVTELQRFLVSYYELDETTSISGFFGRITQANVIRFQREQGLPTFGIVGILTRAAIARVCASAATAPAWTPPSPVPQPQPSATAAANIKLLSPNGGETYEAGSGKTLTISWTASGMPAGAKVCALLIREGSGGGGFAFPPENRCTYAQNGRDSLSGSLIRTSGYDLGPGSYRARINVLPAPTPCTNPYGCKDDPDVASDISDAPFKLIEPTYTPLPTPSVTLTASPSSILIRQSSTISWNSTNANICFLQSSSQYEPWTESVATNGSKTVSPSQTTSYKFACTNDPGTGKDGPSAEKNVTVNVTYPTHVFNGSGVQINSGPNAAAYLAAVNVVPGSSFTMSGTASVNGPLTVVLVEIKYAGRTDWNAVSQTLKDDNGYRAVSNTAPVSEGTWSASFGGLPEGYYHILIYDASYNLKGSGFLVSTGKG